MDTRLDNVRITPTDRRSQFGYKRYNTTTWLLFFRYIVLNDNAYDLRIRMPMWRFFEYVKWWYLQKVASWEKFHVVIRDMDSGELITFVPSWRFTETYKNRVMYKFYHTLDMKLYYWITLTTVPYTGNSIYDYASKFKSDLAKLWKRFYDYQKKYDKDIKFIRVYELTKNNTLHVHVAIFSKLTDNILKKNIVLQNNTFGFVKAYKYVGHELKSFKSKDNQTWYETYVSKYYESWYKDGKVSWKYKGMQRSSNKTMNYVLKYMNKNGSQLHHALFTFFRVRTYAISRNITFPKITRVDTDGNKQYELDHYYRASPEDLSFSDSIED